jgi:hypothetical protein
MATYQKLDLSATANSANQTIQMSTTIDDESVTLNLTFCYNEIAEYWVMSITDDSNTLLLDSIPILTGEYPAANILGQYAYLGIGSLYCINSDNYNADYPDDNSFGNHFVLYWGDTPSS